MIGNAELSIAGIAFATYGLMVQVAAWKNKAIVEQT